MTVAETDTRELVGGAVLNDGTIIRVMAGTKPRYYRPWMLDGVIRDAVASLRAAQP